MKPPAVASNYAALRDEGRSSAEILILPDGRLLAHNITPALAAVLAELAPHDETMHLRATSVSAISSAQTPPAPLALPSPTS